MKIYNTRFNPTTDGDLHIGHIYVAAVNEAEAHASGGDFIVRFDDNQEIWDVRIGEQKQRHYADGMRQTLEWLGFNVDEYQSSREAAPHVYEVLKKIYPMGLTVIKQVFVNNSPELVYSDMIAYPYHSHLTITKVIEDMMSCVNLLIRGEDLITESSLYAYFCDMLRIPAPRQVYLPRLLNSNGKELSKTIGAQSILELRDAGIRPEAIWNLLRVSCLKDPEGDFRIDNLLKEPALVEEFDISK